MDGHQTGAQMVLKMYAGVEITMQTKHEARYGAMMHLLGRSAQDPFGNNAFVKKIKRGTVNWDF